ncbi:tastin isoform X1 [Nannospalax galili]|uniref:tastin isoform X1 n=1 Tax=Nannospalax galili TaxID=1026970 RepID=UPI00111C14FF|nr:tastin isoform X1 [Nannospalax galili]XP_029426497.1 tastin isoform X1 [Nannospalax galili]
MTTLQTTKDPRLRGVHPTPSKIPVLSQRCPEFSTVKPCSLDQENQDPRRLVQKPPLGTQRSLVDPAGLRSTVLHQTEKSQRLMGTQPRNPLEELTPSPGVQNVGFGHPPQTEATGAIEFVADPAALATILSGEGVKSCPLGRQSSLAQRVLVRGNKGGTIRRGQSARSSAYMAPRTPIHRLDPARASCFSRLEGPGPRGQTLCPQRLEALNPPSGLAFHPSTRLSLQELRRETCGSSRRTSVIQASRLHPETPAQPGEYVWGRAGVDEPPALGTRQKASSLPEGEHESVPHSDEGGGALLGLAQRVPLRETQVIMHTRGSSESLPMPSPAPVAQPVSGCVMPPVIRPSPFGQAQRVPSPGLSAVNSYSSLRRFAIRPKTQFTPIRSAPRVQKAQWLRGLSPHSCPEEPPLPWEQIAVRLFDQDSCITLQEGSGKLPVASPFKPHPNKTPNFQELKVQRISILQQLLRHEVEGLVVDKCAPLNGGSALDMTELQPLLATISRTLNVPKHNSGTSHLPGLSKCSELPELCLAEECEEPQPCPGDEGKVAQPCPPTEPEPLELSEPSQEQPEVLESSPPSLPSPQGQAGPPEACPRIELRASAAHFLEARSPESSPLPSCSQGPPATTSLTFSSQSPLCASLPIHSFQSLRPQTGQSGPSSLAPRTLALRQRLKACLAAIHCSHEARLDDECAFYTSRTPPPGPTRVCTNPVAMLLEWQDALCFIPVGSVVPQGSPS